MFIFNYLNIQYNKKLKKKMLKHYLLPNIKFIIP